MRVEDGRRPRVYRCDQCSYEGTWGEKDWQQYGSIEDEENQTEAHLCSDDCRREFNARLAIGAVVMPERKRNGTMKREPKGYGAWA